LLDYENKNFILEKSTYRHGRRQQGGRGPSWIFIHGTDIVDRGIIMLFFSLFSVAPPPPEEA